jgi:hypothetical protein
VTFESDKHLSTVGKLVHSLKPHNAMKLPRRVINKLKKILHPTLGKKTVISERTVNNIKAGQDIKIKRPRKNGIAIFPIDALGNIARSPDQVFVRKKFCRLENIDFFEGTCVITDVSSHSLLLYDLYRGTTFKHPVQTVNLGNAAPHGAKFSPDGRLLITSCLGLKIVDQEPQFYDWESPREDKIFVFERAI